MDKETALQAWKQMRSEIDPDNWLFVGTINPEMVDRAIEALEQAPKWIPVTADTLPKEGKVVVVCGEGGTWDFGTYRGHLSSANKWNWKKNTVKTVYWWMYKEDALPEPYKGE
jgi:hypothetical protein